MPALPLDDFLDDVHIDDVFEIPRSVLERARQLAHRCHVEGRHLDTEIMCRGLLAVDHECPWTRALYAAALRALGRRAEALAQVHRGLAVHPQHPLLRFLQDELEGDPPDGPPPHLSMPEAA
jgi:hypothetical protein